MTGEKTKEFKTLRSSYMKKPGRRSSIGLTIKQMFYNLDITKIWVDIQRTHAYRILLMG
jgi:hypothetical protein